MYLCKLKNSIMRRVILLLLTLATALTATAQHNKWDHLDTLIGESQYSTAYPLAMKYFKTAFDNYRTAPAVLSLEGYREAGGYVSKPSLDFSISCSSPPRASLPSFRNARNQYPK